MTSAGPSTHELDQLWTELAGMGTPGAAGRQTRRVLAGSRYDCFLAVDFPSHRRLLSVVSEDREVNPGPDRRHLTTGVLLERGVEPTSHRPTVDLVLRDEAHSDIYTALVADLLDALADADGSVTSGQLLLTRIEEWQQMLAAVSPQGLSPERQRGLFGELAVLADILLPELGARAVLDWTGPDQHLQDFQFPAGAVEVKTVSGHKAHLVRITSERQLDDRAAGRLFLVTLALDARHAGPGLSLPELVGELRRRTRAKGVSAEFEQRLTRAGYLETQAHLYADSRYAVRQRMVHLVGEGFPKIMERDLPAGLSDVSYTLDLLAASAFRSTEREMTNSLRSAT